MTDDSNSSAAASESSPSVAPSLHLSSGGLIACLCAMILMGLGVYALFPDSVGGPPLPVEVALGHELVETRAGITELTEVVIITNNTDFEIPRLSIEINGQYSLRRASPLPVGEPLVIAQRIFTDKRSSQRYNPVDYPATEVIVTGQLPSGARGVTKFEFENASGENQ